MNAHPNRPLRRTQRRSLRPETTRIQRCSGALGRAWASSVAQIARALLVAILLATAQPVHSRELGLAMSGVSDEELERFATSFRSAIESGQWHQVENLIHFPLRVNTGPRQFRLVSKAEFISEYNRVFSPSVRAAILAQDLGSLQRQWRAISSAGSIVSVEGICPWGNCKQPLLRVTAVNLGEARKAE